MGRQPEPVKVGVIVESDNDYVKRIRAGDPDGFRDLMLRYSGELYGYALSLVGNAADAEDVVQQAFVGAMRSMDRFEGRSSVRTWLYTILMNQASKLRRSRRVRHALSLSAVADAAGSEGRSGGEEMLTVRSASAAVDGKLDVAAMLEALTPEHREVIVLRELQGLTYEEMAEVLEISRGTVESRLFRARRALRQRFPNEIQ